MGKVTTMDNGKLRRNEEGSIKLRDFFECGWLHAGIELQLCRGMEWLRMSIEWVEGERKTMNGSLGKDDDGGGNKKKKLKVNTPNTFHRETHNSWWIQQAMYEAWLKDKNRWVLVGFDIFDVEKY